MIKNKNFFLFTRKTYRNHIHFCSPFVWRKIYIIHYIPFGLKDSTRKNLFERGTIVPKCFVNEKIFLHSGKTLRRRYVNRWMVGFMAGEFVWTRKKAIYKAKQVRKKLAKIAKDKAKEKEREMKRLRSLQIAKMKRKK